MASNSAQGNRRSRRRQQELWPTPPRPRRWLMQVRDAGHAGGGQPAVHLVCPRCGYDDGWTPFTTITESQRRPCPICNANPERGER